MIEPFQVAVPDVVLTDLRERLARTRFPDQIDGTGWDYGAELGTVRRLVEYWRDEFDWRAAEARINAFPQFRTTIDGQSIHFIHARSPHADATPLLLAHGWPGSVVEFLDVIEALCDPESHGGRASDAFHVVCPSLPGYGFSEPTRTTAWDPHRMAEAFVELMGRLGHSRYGVQGGDWGAVVTTEMALEAPDRICGIHLNMPLAIPRAGADLDEAGKADLAAMRSFGPDEVGYQKIQGTRPQSLGFGLNDSPAGLLAWIVEKMRAWSDCGGDVESAFSRDQILTNVTVYWVTETITSSARLYYEQRRHADRLRYPKEKVGVPTGVARFPKEMMRYPRAWVERHYDIHRWTDMPRGGHFAAMEQPQLFVEDVRAFFASLPQAKQ